MHALLFALLAAAPDFALVPNGKAGADTGQSIADAAWDGSRFAVLWNQYERGSSQDPLQLTLVSTKPDGAAELTTVDLGATIASRSNGTPRLACAKRSGSKASALNTGTCLAVFPRAGQAAPTQRPQDPGVSALLVRGGKVLKRVELSAELVDVDTPLAVAAADDRFFVAWTSDRHVHAARVDLDGAVLDATPLDLFPGATAREPAIAWTNKTFLVAVSCDDQCATRAVRVDAAGKVLDAKPISIGPPDARGTIVHVARDDEGFLVANLGDTFVARVTPGGKVIGLGREFPRPPDALSFLLANDARGALLASMKQGVLSITRLTAATTPSPGASYELGRLHAPVLRVVADDSGRWLIVDGSGAELRGRFFTPAARPHR